MQVPPPGPPRTGPRAQRTMPVRPTGSPSRPPADAEAVLSGAEAVRVEAPDALNVAAQFVVDDITGRILVRIYDSSTGETIRTIPPTKVVNLMLEVMGAESVGRLNRLG